MQICLRDILSGCALYKAQEEVLRRVGGKNKPLVIILLHHQGNVVAKIPSFNVVLDTYIYIYYILWQDQVVIEEASTATQEV